MDHSASNYYDASANAVAWSPWLSNNGKNGIVLATGADHTVTVWDPITGERIWVDIENDRPVSCLAFSNSGLFASASGNEIKIRRTGTWEELSRITDESDITAIDWCCYHKFEPCLQPLLAYGSADGSISIVDISNSRKKMVEAVHASQVNSVKWMGFPHTSLVSASDGKIVELELELDGLKLEKSTRKAISARKAKTLMAVPYQPKGSDVGVPYPSILKNDQTVGLIGKKRRMDSLAIGRSVVSVANRKIEYTFEERTLATAEAGSRIEAVSWVGDSPFNFCTGHSGNLILWSIKILHRSEILNHLIGWLKPNRISVEIDAVASIKKAHSDRITAIAYPPIRRSWSNPEHPWLMASASRDATVRLWDINSIRESRKDYELRRFSQCVGMGAMNGIPRYDIGVEPEYLLKRTFSGLAARRR